MTTDELFPTDATVGHWFGRLLAVVFWLWIAFLIYVAEGLI